MLPPLDTAPVLRPPTAARSPFERTLLPGFARWFTDQVRAYDPDVVVPVETKGARLLEATLAYAATTLDAPVRSRVVYTPALAYMDRDELARRRVLLVDDAARTGQTLARHRDRVEGYGARDVHAVTCIAARGSSLPGVEPYRWVGDEMYREYLWQLTELVISRGLPPEVDHNVFRLTMTGGLVDGWTDLREYLGGLGHLTVDGAVTTSADVESMTLHFPAFPGAPRYPRDGAVRDEGVKKLRLFLDKTRRAIYVVPIAFPALDLPPGTDRRDLPKEDCAATVAQWTLGRSTIADILLDEAKTRDADLLFRAISTATETDLVVAFARGLGHHRAGVTLALACERDLFARLYGAETGARVADRIDRDVAAAFADGGAAPRRSAEASPPPNALREQTTARIDAAVIMGTKRIEGYLTALAVAHARDPDADQRRRVGLSAKELAQRVPPSGFDRLLLSRCIDYGLARTILVPYIDVDECEDGRVRVRRKYRVSEKGRDEDFEDEQTFRNQQDEEVIALVASGFARHTTRWESGSVPYRVVASAIAILNPCVLDAQSAHVEIQHARSGPELMLGEPGSRASIYARSTPFASRHFTHSGDDITPTPRFAERYEKKTLRLDVRGDATTVIEPFIRALAEAVEHSDDDTALLLRWSVVADSRMGLEVVEHHLREALDAIDQPLRRAMRGEMPDLEEVLAAVERAEDLIEVAMDVARRIADDVSGELRGRWPRADRIEGRLIDSATSPRDPPALLGLARQTCEAARDAARQFSALARAANDSAEAERATAAEAVAALARAARGLISLGAHDGDPPSVDGDAMAARVLAAEEIQRMVNLVRIRAAALAWRSCSLPRRDEQQPERRRRTVLVADITDSTWYSMEHEHGENHEWVTSALDLVLQWGRAFGGRQTGARGGDDIRLEFRSADSAVLCAAVVQVHAEALRKSGRDGVGWGFRIAVDTGEVTSEPDNDTGSCLNVASKLAEFCEDDAEATRRVLLMPEVAEQCSAALREGLLEPMPEPFRLDAGPTSIRPVECIPFSVDAPAAVAALLGQPPVRAETVG